MELGTLVLAVVLTLVLLLVARAAIRRFQYIRKLSGIPGPKAYPIIGCALEFLLPINKFEPRIAELIIQHGAPALVWIGPYAVISLHAPEHVEAILGNPQHNEKSMQYEFLEPWLGTGLLTSRGEKWHTHRKMITPTFHFKILENFVPVFCEKSEILVDRLEKQAGGNSFDIYPYITKCALDIICETAMGIEMNTQQQEVDSDYVKAIYNLTEATMKRMLLPWLYPDQVFSLTSFGRRYYKSLKTLHSFTNKVIREKKQLHRAVQNPESSDEDLYLGSRKRRKAFLDLLLDGYELTDEELREEVDTFMFEGHDTTTAAMCWTLQALGTHPDIQNKVHEELDSIFQASDRSVTMKDLSEMKYLELVIKESLRLYPSVPMIGRIIRKEVKIGKYMVPPGVTALINIYFLHRNADHFPDPDKFDPERFLPEKTAVRHPYAYVPFSAGSRNCIGQKFALLEEKTVLSYILRKYKVTAEKSKLTPLLELILRAENGVPISLSRRQPAQ